MCTSCQQKKIILPRSQLQPNVPMIWQSKYGRIFEYIESHGAQVSSLISHTRTSSRRLFARVFVLHSLPKLRLPQLMPNHLAADRRCRQCCVVLPLLKVENGYRNHRWTSPTTVQAILCFSQSFSRRSAKQTHKFCRRLFSNRIIVSLFLFGCNSVVSGNSCDRRSMAN